MQSTSPLGTRGSVPEATSALLFGLVVALLWFALAHGRDVEARAGHPNPGTAGASGLTDVPSASPASGTSAAIGRP